MPVVELMVLVQRTLLRRHDEVRETQRAPKELTIRDAQLLQARVCARYLSSRGTQKGPLKEEGRGVGSPALSPLVPNAPDFDPEVLILGPSLPKSS